MPAIFSLLSGCALTFAFAPYHWWGLGIFSLVSLCYLWLRPECRRPGFIGFCFGLGYFSTGIYWVYISLYYYGDAPLIFAILANIVLILFLSCFPLLIGWLLGKLSKPASYYRAFLIPLLWMSAELVRAYILSGFPWLSIGYSQLHALLDGLAPIAGVMAVGLALISLCTLIANGLLHRCWTSFFFSALLLVFILATKLFSFTIAVGKPFSVALIQGNVEQDDKFSQDSQHKHLEDYITLTATREESVIIWPETAITYFENTLKDNVLAELDKLTQAKKQALITGILAQEGEQYYNAVISLGQANGRYYKNHLLPFGEYTPLANVFAIFNDYVYIPLNGFSRGGSHQQLMTTYGIPAGVSICFEAAFGREIRHSLPSAQYLINVSNDAWFKDSIAAEQHLQLNQMRALEMGREMARATNNGVSVFIDHKGYIQNRLPRFTQDVLSGSIQPRIGLTPYAKFGNTIIAIVLIAYAIIAGLIFPWRNRYARTLPTQFD